jgi:hypothetical protein
MKGDKEMRRLVLALVLGFVLVVSCAPHKEDAKIPPLDITSGTWIGTIGLVGDVSVEFYTDEMYKLTQREGEMIGTYTLIPNADGSYGLEMKYRGEVVVGVKDDEGYAIKTTHDYVGNISFKNGQWYAIGRETMGTLSSIGSKFSLTFDFEWIQVK